MNVVFESEGFVFVNLGTVQAQVFVLGAQVGVLIIFGNLLNRDTGTCAVVK